MGDDAGAIDWRRIYKEALHGLLDDMPLQRAEEAVAAGVEAVYLGEEPWDPNGDRSLVEHVKAVGRERVRRERRTLLRRQRPDLAAKAAEVVGENPPTPEQALEEKQRKTRLYQLLVAACIGDADALAVIEAEREGVRGLAAQMEHLKMKERRLMNARDRIGERMKKIVEDEDRKEAAS